MKEALIGILLIAVIAVPMISASEQKSVNDKLPAMRINGTQQIQQAKASYSAIVYISGKNITAEDSRGKAIFDGLAGRDDAIAIQAASDYLSRLREDGIKVLYLPPGTYIITKPISILPKVELRQDGWLKNMISNSSAPIIQFLEFSQATCIQVDANHKTGILIGNYSNTQSSAHFGSLKIINAGNQMGQYAVRITGYNVRFDHLETTYGDIGLDLKNASDIQGTSVLIVNAGTAIRSTGSEHIQLLDVDCDSSRHCSIQIDASHDFTMDGTMWFNKDVYRDNPDYGMLLGNYSKCSGLNLNFNLIGCAQTGIRMDKINASLIDVLMSNAPLYTSTYPIKTAIIYGSNGENIGDDVKVQGIIGRDISLPKLIHGIMDVN